MSSILTNNGAMVALQTLKNTNRNMADVQNQISTGKQINSAKDNAATWAISKVMEADVTGFKAISDSLSLGESTVAVARNATETVTDLLKEIKGKITSSQEANVDREKINTDISALRDQITSVVSAAQFNGLNLINGEAESPVKVMASLDRGADGSVTAKTIDVSAQNLAQTASQVGTTAGAAGTVSAATAAANGGISTYDLSGSGDGEGISFEFDLTVVGGTGTAFYVQKDGETATEGAAGLAERITFALAEQGIEGIVMSAENGEMTLTNNTDTAINTVAGDVDVTTDGTAGGGLEMLSKVDVSSENGAKAALSAIEGLIQSSIDGAASFGSVEKRIEIQNDFVDKLTDSMKSGIGSLVDADMEETSARLQALQVQQQLGIQSLSMANQAPQSVLSLFR